MNETIAINRCKNCGSESADIYVNGSRHIVHCEAVGCGAHGPYADTPREAVDGWNNINGDVENAKKWLYFVSFSDKHGFGNITIAWDCKINNFAAVKEVKKYIKQRANGAIILSINYLGRG